MGFNMRNEEEVRQFLENLEIEYTFSCYKENSGTGCCLLGEFMQTVRRNYPKASAAFRKGCDEHDSARACFKYGGDLFRGRGVERDLEKALGYQKKACDLGWKEGCLAAGLQYNMKGPLRNGAAATEYFIRACDLNAEDGCANASSTLYQGDGIAKDLQKSLEYGIRACELGHMRSCANVSFMYKNGLGADKDLEKSTEFKARALDLQQQAQKKRGFEMEQGTGAESS